MRRYHLFPILTFLAGLAVGIFATGGYGKPPEPAESSTTPDVAGILNSSEEEAGLQPGDLIELYGDTRVLWFEDLSTATSEGERGELVPVRIRRDDGIVETWLPRGPLGVRMDRARVDPDA